MSPEKATAMKNNLKLGRNTYMEIVKIGILIVNAFSLSLMHLILGSFNLQ